jgi:hypothetical protein
MEYIRKLNPLWWIGKDDPEPPQGRGSSSISGGEKRAISESNLI